MEGKLGAFTAAAFGVVGSSFLVGIGTSVQQDIHLHLPLSLLVLSSYLLDFVLPCT